MPDSTTVTSAAIVVNVGAVKHGRRTSSTINRDDGTVTGTWTSPVRPRTTRGASATSGKGGHRV
ncbi:hypothetical protein [Streptomyces sp. NPDC005374]|uniref:hypothetical protein n=1 Tax=Streptomyces sp. NPDC005374 TaxID=3364713 RepID=UPI0036B714FA